LLEHRDEVRRLHATVGVDDEDALAVAPGLDELVARALLRVRPVDALELLGVLLAVPLGRPDEDDLALRPLEDLPGVAAPASRGALRVPLGAAALREEERRVELAYDVLHE